MWISTYLSTYSRPSHKWKPSDILRRKAAQEVNLVTGWYKYLAYFNLSSNTWNCTYLQLHLLLDLRTEKIYKIYLSFIFSFSTSGICAQNCASVHWWKWNDWTTAAKSEWCITDMQCWGCEHHDKPGHKKN